MCGIVGIIEFDGPQVAPALLGRMLSEILHRGPDADGAYVDHMAALGHSRLNTMDPDSGRQPMCNEDRSVWVTCDGEIFNYIDLRGALEAKGHRFATRLDAEVILHLYEDHGEDCAHHLNGQWAFAIWDTRRRSILLSRDRLGIRPLYYTQADGKLLFASEVKSLLVHPQVHPEIDPVGLGQMFSFETTLPPRTVFRGVSELPPGHNLVVRSNGMQLRRYWQLRYEADGENATTKQWAERLAHLLADATRLRLRPDMPVGVYLSGRLDSAIATALVKQCMGTPPESFSVAFDDAEFDESESQRKVAEALGTNHRTIRPSPDDIAHLFPDVIRATERPVFRTAPARWYLLSQLLCDQGCQMVVTGEGADEMLGGCDIFKEIKIRQFCARQPGSGYRALLFKRLYPHLPNVQDQSADYLAAFFRTRADELGHPLASHLPRWQLTSRLKSFFSTDFRNELAYHDPYAEILESLPDPYDAWDPFSKAQYLETMILLAGYSVSSRGGRVGMASSVERRSPFLDHRVAELAAQMPSKLKMKGLDEKYILKLAARHLIPVDVVRHSKPRYPLPEAACFVRNEPGAFRHDYAEELLSPERIRDDGVFCPVAVEQLVRKARGGRVVGIKDSMALVGVLSTQLVVDQLIGQPASASHPMPTDPAPVAATIEMTSEPAR